jgi:hypothetical protein
MEIVLRMQLLDVKIMILLKSVLSAKKVISCLGVDRVVISILSPIVKCWIIILTDVWNVRVVFGRIWMEGAVDIQWSFVRKCRRKRTNA